MNKMIVLIIGGAGLLAVAAWLIITSITPQGTSPQVSAPAGGAPVLQDTVFVGDIPITLQFQPQKEVRLQSEVEIDFLATQIAQQQAAEAQATALAQQQAAQTEPTATPTATSPAQAQAATATPNPLQARVTFVNYTVVDGDTLYRLTTKLNTTIELMAQHDIASGDIVPGRQLRVPVADTASCPNSNAYIVQPRDNLFRIALRFGTTVEAIRSLNGISGDRIMVSQVLCVPGTPPPATSTATPDPNVNCGANTPYVVVRGDTLYSLARRYNTTVVAIRNLNGIGDDNRIIAGKTICIPAGSG